MEKVINPVFQPVLDAVTGAPLYYEALARTRNGGSHVDLIELGEFFGFVDMIDIGMAKQVINALRRSPGVCAGVNVSVVTIEQSCGDLLAILFRNRDVVSRMVFEITETAAIGNLEVIHLFMSAVRLLKGRIALDDWGTGYFTLEIVEALRPDFLKLSYRVVRNLIGECHQIESLRKAMGGEASIIAECVDTPEKLALIRQLKVQYVQGFLLGPIVQSLPAQDSEFIGNRQEGEKDNVSVQA